MHSMAMFVMLARLSDSVQVVRVLIEIADPADVLDEVATQRGSKRAVHVPGSGGSRFAFRYDCSRYASGT